MEIIEEIWDSFETISADESSHIKIGKILDREKIDKLHKEVINTVYNIFDKLQEKNEKNTINEEPKELIFEINDKDYKEINIITIESMWFSKWKNIYKKK